MTARPLPDPDPRIITSVGLTFVSLQIKLFLHNIEICDHNAGETRNGAWIPTLTAHDRWQTSVRFGPTFQSKISPLGTAICDFALLQPVNTMITIATNHNAWPPQWSWTPRHPPTEIVTSMVLDSQPPPKRKSWPRRTTLACCSRFDLNCASTTMIL